LVVGLTDPRVPPGAIDIQPLRGCLFDSSFIILTEKIL